METHKLPKHMIQSQWNPWGKCKVKWPQWRDKIQTDPAGISWKQIDKPIQAKFDKTVSSFGKVWEPLKKEKKKKGEKNKGENPKEQLRKR